MSGQHPSNLTPEQGWAAMRDILDREMPVRRRRRAGLWWLPLTVAAGLALAFWIRTPDESASPAATPGIASESFHSDVKQSTDVQVSGGQSAADVKPNVDNASTVSTAPSSSHQSSSGISKAVAPSSPASNSIPVARASTAHAQIVPSDMASPAIAPATHEMNEVASPVGETDASTVQIAISPSGTDVDHPTESPMRTTKTTDLLPVLGADGVLHETNAPAIEGISFGRMRPAHPITPYVSLAGLVGTTQGMGTAVAAGAGVRLNRWLSATTGLGYQWMNAQSSFLGGFATARDLSNAGSPLTEMDFSGTTSGGTVIPEGNLVNAVEASDLTPLVDRVNQWQWHVGLEGHLGPRLKLEAGYTLGWGTKVTTQYPIVDAMGMPLESLDSDGSSLNDYGLVKSRSSLLYGGIAYAPARWLEIFGRYAHDMGHYLDLNSPQALAAGSAQGNDKLSCIQVGVRAMLRP